MKPLVCACTLLTVCLVVSNEAAASEPCCNVTAIDARSGLVSARESATGRTFQFKVDEAVPPNSVKVGQVVEADFKTMKVTVRPAGGAVCCAITAVDASGVVTVKDNATGRLSQITVRDTRLLSTLKVGLTVDANVSAGTIAIAPTGMIVK